jgi:activator of 2-hydroxyglutaryl-CoA dehydratase
VSSSVIPTGVKNIEAIDAVKKNLIATSSIMEKQIQSIISTGYGRIRVEERDGTVTEITCHAKGIHLNEDSNVKNFAMNDKYAVGTGRFL